MKTITLVLFGLFITTHAHANSTHESRIDALEKKVQTLTEAAGDKQTAQDLGKAQGARYLGAKQGNVTIGGYGEVVWRKASGDSDPTKVGQTTDVYRFVPYISYGFTENLSLNSEIEFEHSNQVVIELLYLDYNFWENYGVQIGHFFIPVGLVNTSHEPIFFPMVDRPRTERFLIPSTWHENGINFYNTWGDLKYSYGLMTAPNAANYSASSWIRGGRQKGGQATANDHVYYLSFDYNIDDFGFIGGSIVSGNSAQGNEALGDANLSISEIHGQFQKWGARLSFLFAQGSLSDTDKIFTATGQGLGEKSVGYYATLEYDVLQFLGVNDGQKLNLFLHYNFLNLHDSVDPSITKNETLETTSFNLGFNYYPTEQVVVKVEHENLKEKSGDTIDSTKVGLGFIF